MVKKEVILTVELMSKKITFIDLFAGIGGMRLAFELAGAECVYTCEIDKAAMVTYKTNFEVKENEFAPDITKIKNKALPKHTIMIAGFPCQPYSIAGLRKGLADERGQVFNDLLRLIKQSKPEVFLLENVKGIRTHEQGATFEYILERLKKLGYTVTHQTLNTATHSNIPQNRERVFIVGFRDSKVATKFTFPTEVKLTTKVNSLLEKKVPAKYYYDGRFDCYTLLKKEMTDKNKVYQWRRQYVRENKSGLCPTLTANMGSGGHNVPLVLDKKGIRKLTPRECARLQGFPESYQLPNLSDSSLYHQFGNSVTVGVIARIAEQIVKALSI